MTTNPQAAAGPIEVTVTRVLDAPLDLVWKVWTEPEHAKHWWGPPGFTATAFESDLRPGGAIFRQFRAPDGNVVTITSTYLEVVPLQRTVASGTLQRPGEPASEIRTTSSFEERDGKTIVTVQQVYSKMTAAAAAEAAAGARNGWAHSFERLEAHLASLVGR